MELKIINVLDYKLNSWTFFDLITLKLSQYAFQEESIKRPVLGELFIKNSPIKTKVENKEDQIKKLEQIVINIEDTKNSFNKMTENFASAIGASIESIKNFIE